MPMNVLSCASVVTGGVLIRVHTYRVVNLQSVQCTRFGSGFVYSPAGIDGKIVTSGFPRKHDEDSDANENDDHSSHAGDDRDLLHGQFGRRRSGAPSNRRVFRIDHHGGKIKVEGVVDDVDKDVERSVLN